MRFGDPKLHAGSVTGHLHWNLQIPTGLDHVSAPFLQKRKRNCSSAQKDMGI